MLASKIGEQLCDMFLARGSRGPPGACNVAHERPPPAAHGRPRPHAEPGRRGRQTNNSKGNRNRQSKERRDTYTRHSRREARALLALALGLAAQPHGGAAEAAVFV